MTKGDRVMTPGGKGGVASVRMGGPDYTKPLSVSVVLDSRKNDINYTGTTYPADKVFKIDE